MKKDEEKTIVTELQEARERLQYLFAVSPAIIYTNQASGDFACTFVSENLQSIMGHTSREMLDDPKFWPTRVHPEDASRVFADIHQLIGQGGGTICWSCSFHKIKRPPGRTPPDKASKCVVRRRLCLKWASAYPHPGSMVLSPGQGSPDRLPTRQVLESRYDAD